MVKRVALLVLPLGIALGCQLAFPFDRTLIEDDTVDAGGAAPPVLPAGDDAAAPAPDASSDAELADAGAGDADASVFDATSDADAAGDASVSDAAIDGASLSDAAPEAD